MKILAIEPYYGGSHRAFLDGWVSHSRHAWTLVTLPPHNWKWRMRHSAVTAAAGAVQHVDAGKSFDAIFCSDMLNLAEFRGLCPPTLASLPSVVYFHENQLTYPVRHDDPRDVHFGLINFTTALAATGVWFNSAYHRDDFCRALRALLKKMPDHQHLGDVDTIESTSFVQHPGIDPPAHEAVGVPTSVGMKRPLHILYAARWEHDKGAETFWQAIEMLAKTGADFRLSIIGQHFREQPAVFADARKRFTDKIDRWGYQETPDDYTAALAEADVFVSAAEHEFFGIAAVEAVAAGAWPLLPDRLAYPEVFADLHTAARDQFFYNGTAAALAQHLKRLAEHPDLSAHASLTAPAVARYLWSSRAPEMDAALDTAHGQRPQGA